MLNILFIKTKLFLREYIAFFFTLVFCPVMLILFGGIYGNSPSPLFGNLGTVDISVPSYTGLILTSSGLISLPIAIASSKEKGELRRFKMTPISPILYLFMDVIVYFFLSVLGMILTALIGYFMYDATFSGNIFTTGLGILISSMAVFSIGLFIAAISKTARTAQALGMFIGFPMMLLSGASMPLELLPKGLLGVAKLFPLYHQVKMMRSMWIGEDLSVYGSNMLILIGITIAFTVLTVLTFKWE